MATNEELAPRESRPRPLGHSDGPEGIEGFLERLLPNLPGIAYRCAADPSWTMEFVSGCVRTLTGFEASDLVGNRVVSFADLIHPNDRSRVGDEVWDAIERNQPYRVTYRIRKVDGRVRFVFEKGAPVWGPTGRLEALEGFISDITDHTELRSQFDRTALLNEALTDQSLVSVFELRHGRFTHVNERCAEILGRSVSQLMEMPSISEIVHAEDWPEVSEQLRRLEEGEESVVGYEHRCTPPGGVEHVVRVHATSIVVDRDVSIAAMMVDVTEEHQTQQMHQEVERMRAMGSLAAGVAHDFKNLLGIIAGSADLLELSLGNDPAVAADLAEIQDAVERGASLSRQLMAFGQARASAVERVNLNELLTKLSSVLEQLLGKTIDLVLSLDDDVPPVLWSEAEAERLIINLVVNARDAITGTGQVTITTSSKATGHARSHASVRHEPHAVLSIADSGCGIPPDVMPYMFEPYFTTKGDKGTGLGLGNVWRIASEVRGHVDVASPPGAGATFTVHLPAHAANE